MSTTVSAEYLAESRAGVVRGVMWTSAVLPLIFVSLRCYVRIGLRKTFGLDDAFAIMATAFLIAYAAVCTVASNRGLGRHIEFVEETPQDVVTVALLADIGEALAILACTLGKSSFAITLMRIVVQRWILYVLWFIIITMNLANILAAIFVFAQCKDPRHNWDPTTYPSECWPAYVFTNFSLFVGSYSGAQDFVMAFLPMAMLWNLQMKKKEKVAIAFAMSLGIFAGIAAIVKCAYLVSLSEKSDFSYVLAPLLWWAAAEDGLTIIASSIPTLRPLLTKVFPSSSARNSDYPLKTVREDGNPPFWKVESKHSAAGDGRRPNQGFDNGSDTSILERSRTRAKTVSEGEGETEGV